MAGGARGLGNAIAVSFVREGARGVVIMDISEATLGEGKKIVECHGTKVHVLYSRSRRHRQIRLKADQILKVPSSASRRD